MMSTCSFVYILYNRQDELLLAKTAKLAIILRMILVSRFAASAFIVYLSKCVYYVFDGVLPSTGSPVSIHCV